MIRTIIATPNGDSVSLEQTAEPALIAKVLRQGGQRIWVDAADADSTERDWISQTFGLSLTLLDTDYPLCNLQHGLTLCLQTVLFHDNHYETLPVISRATPNTATLLTVRSLRVKAIDEVFQRAAKTELDWKDSTAPLLFGITTATLETMTSALSSIAHSYTDTSGVLIGNALPDDVPKLLINLYQWRSDAAHLLDIAAPFALLLDTMAQSELIAPHEELSAHFAQLAMGIAQRRQTVSRQLTAADSLIAIVHARQLISTAGQSARLGRSVRSVRTLLLIMFPLITGALGALALPIRADEGFTWALIFILVLYVIEFIAVRLTR